MLWEKKRIRGLGFVNVIPVSGVTTRPANHRITVSGELTYKHPKGIVGPFEKKIKSYSDRGEIMSHCRTINRRAGVR